MWKNSASGEHRRIWRITCFGQSLRGGFRHEYYYTDGRRKRRLCRCIGICLIAAAPWYFRRKSNILYCGSGSGSGSFASRGNTILHCVSLKPRAWTHRAIWPAKPNGYGWTASAKYPSAKNRRMNSGPWDISFAWFLRNWRAGIRT